MAGIAGWMAVPRNAPDDRVILAVLEALAHRGPEGAGASAFRGAVQRAVLGQRPQLPFCDEQSGVAVACDGDIDNAGELRAELEKLGQGCTAGSEAELVSRAYRQWGQDFVRRLRGAFALALWDPRQERLLLARDRFGERPLYLCEAGGSVFFASEVKALLRIPGIEARVDLHAVGDYLRHGYVPAPRTLFSGIRKLAPASCAFWQDGRRRELRYWTPPDRHAWAGGATPAPVTGFVAQLEAAIKLQAQGDAPCGAFLSGGLNSASVVALMARHRPKVMTFSVGFADARASDLPRAARVARQLGTEHHELVVPRKGLGDGLAALIAARDAPLGAPEDIALYRLARAAAATVQRVLTGEGADEVLAGEARHVRERLGWPFARGDWRLRCMRAAGGLDRAQCDRLGAPLLNGAPLLDAEANFVGAAGASRLRRLLYFEQTRLLPDHLVERSERTAIAASVRARAPFLDYRLAEYVSALPDQQRVRGLRGKWLLRQAAPGLLPKGLGRACAGLRLGARAWLDTELRGVLLDYLHGPSSCIRKYFNAPILNRVLAEYLKGRHQHQPLLWMLLNLEVWHRVYRPG